jgi:hypothetical protein
MISGPMNPGPDLRVTHQMTLKAPHPSLCLPRRNDETRRAFGHNGVALSLRWRRGSTHALFQNVLDWICHMDD